MLMEMRVKSNLHKIFNLEFIKFINDTFNIILKHILQTCLQILNHLIIKCDSFEEKEKEKGYFKQSETFNMSKFNVINIIVICFLQTDPYQ